MTTSTINKKLFVKTIKEKVEKKNPVKNFLLNSPKLKVVDTAYAGLKKVKNKIGNVISNANPLSTKNMMRQGVMNSGNPDYWKNEAKKKGIDLTR